MNNEQKMPIGKGILTTLIVIVAVAAVVVLMMFLDIPMWIPFLGLCIVTGFGVPFTLKDVTKFWLSVAVALCIGFALGHIEQYGVAAIVVAAVGILLMMFGMTTGRMNAVFNTFTAIFVTVSTAAGIVIDPIPSLKGWAFGYVLFGLLPCVLMKLLAKKGEKVSH